MAAVNIVIFNRDLSIAHKAQYNIAIADFQIHVLLGISIRF